MRGSVTARPSTQVSQRPEVEHLAHRLAPPSQQVLRGVFMDREEALSAAGLRE
jgi:hypothetical protein